MGRFEQDFQNYECYEDRDLYKKTVPDGLTDALAEFFGDACAAEEDQETVRRLKTVANALLVMVGKKSTSNWDANVLRTDIRSAFFQLSEEKFDKFMDGTRVAAEKVFQATTVMSKEEFLREIDNILSDKKFGYELRERANDSNALMWEARWKTDTGVSALDSAKEALGKMFPEVLEHLQQAKDHLLRPHEARSRKDSVRDAMSAMEAMIKKLASENDIKKATKKLRAEECWGLDLIVKDGLSIWGQLHEFYPDIRHGQSASSEMNVDEALYWIARMTAYITYMSDRAKAIGR